MNFLIAGLGNIGFEYQDTRHNIGFMILDAWAHASNISFTNDRLANVAEIKFRGDTFTLIKPTTYMNLSGKAVNYWLQKKGIERENLLVVVDDIALPFETIRMKTKGSDGGHNGLKDITAVLGGNNYSRLRIGIGDDFRKGHQVDFVLGKWTKEEIAALPSIADRAIEAIKLFAGMGPERAMNIVNTKKKDE